MVPFLPHLNFWIFVEIWFKKPILPTLWDAFVIFPPISMRSTSNCFNIPVPNKILPLFISIAAPDFGTPFLRKSCRRAWLACSFEPVARSSGLLAVCQMISVAGWHKYRIKNYQKVQSWQKNIKVLRKGQKGIISFKSFVNSNPGSNFMASDESDPCCSNKHT